MASALTGRPINMFGGSPLNRYSWLRTSHHFLNAIVALPQTKWILYNAGQPLVVSDSAPGGTSVAATPKMAFLTTAEITPFLGPQPYFGQGPEPGTFVPEEPKDESTPKPAGPSLSATEAARHYPHSVPLVFLGVHEKQDDLDVSAALPSTEFNTANAAVEAIKKLDGIPYFSMDVADLVAGETFTEEELLKELAKEGKAFAWSDPRALMTGLDGFTGALFAISRSLVDWNYRNKFCPGCGSKTYSMWGGWKISCMSLLPWADNTGRRPCPSGKGLHNYTHPRTDGVVIMIALDETGDKILLGRGRRFPGKFYSAFAGFIEPAESFEDAVVREMWEEAGVRVWNIRYHSGQPWPYPANLMVGFYSRADSTKPIRTDLDNELVDARWFTREEVQAVLARTDGKKDHENSVKAFSTDPTKADGGEEESFRLPPATAIAGVLIRDWAAGKIGFGNETVAPNL